MKPKTRLYFKVNSDFRYAIQGKFRRNFIKNELYTERELERICKKPFAEFSENFMERFSYVSTLPRNTFWNFGARFEVSYPTF